MANKTAFHSTILNAFSTTVSTIAHRYPNQVEQLEILLSSNRKLLTSIPTT